MGQRKQLSPKYFPCWLYTLTGALLFICMNDLFLYYQLPPLIKYISAF